MSAAPTSKRRRDITVAVAAGAFACGMLGAAYAAVPLYQMFCQVTGYGGTTQRVEAPSTRVVDSEVLVRFDANASKSVPWAFQPVEREIRVKLGETRQTSYRVVNRSDKPVTAQATYNVTPEAAGVYFNKITCFCFTEQTLQPGESRDMDVIFYVDPAMLDSEDMKGSPDITLSYTFFPVDAPAPVAAAPGASGKAETTNEL
jgi:cytochrome c oxidase assembly protein subunit 11